MKIIRDGLVAIAAFTFAVGCVVSALAMFSPVGDAFWVMTPIWLPSLAVLASVVFMAGRQLIGRVFDSAYD